MMVGGSRCVVAASRPVRRGEGISPRGTNGFDCIGASQSTQSVTMDAVSFIKTNGMLH